MYLHIGKNTIINKNDIIALFNLDYIKNTKEYKAMKAKLEEEGNLERLTDEKQNSFIITSNKLKTKGYLTNIRTVTIGKRIN